jgi:hypothetical protein
VAARAEERVRLERDLQVEVARRAAVHPAAALAAQAQPLPSVAPFGMRAVSAWPSS